MTHREFYNLLDELLELDPGTVKADSSLKDISKWDSLAIIGFIALIDHHFGANVPAVEIINAKTPQELANLVSDQLSN